VPPDFDPYAPPTEAPPLDAPQVLGMAAWQAFEAREDGPNLTLSKHAALPDVCMRCGLEEPGMFRRLNHFSWVPQAAFFLLCLGWIGIAIIAIRYMKRASFYIPLCATCSAKWKSGQTAFTILLLVVVGLFFGGVLIGPRLFGEAFVGAVFLGTFFVGLPAALVGHRRLVRPNTVWAARISDSHITLANVHPKARAAAVQLSRVWGRLEVPPLP
jgi:hypothetical protein